MWLYLVFMKNVRVTVSMKKTVTHYELNTEKIPESEKPVRIAFLTDLHNCTWGEHNRLLLSLIKAEKPDLVLCGGDIITAHPGTDMEEGLSLIRRLSESWPVYLGVGNHELRLRLYPEVYGSMYQEYLDEVGKTSAVILADGKADITVRDVPLTVYGLDIPPFFYKRFRREYLPMALLKKKLGVPDSERINILMAHLPRHMRNYLRFGADIVLSGHCHGGVIGLSDNRGLISPDFDLTARYTRGSINVEGRLGIISSGLGEHTIPFRISNPRELVIIDICNHKE